MGDVRAVAVGMADGIEAGLRGVGDPERAAQERGYLKSDLEFIGVAVPGIRKVVRGALRAAPELDRELLLALVEELWGRGVYELRSSAVVALQERAGLLEARDLGVLERLIRESKTWALVDPLTADVCGGLLARFPELRLEVDRWSVDADFWVRRAALLVHLGPLRRGEGDFAWFAGYADAMLEEREFFIRKAIGWVLRETAKRRPELVIRWIESRTDRASGVTMREVTRHLPEAECVRLMDAYRAGRAAV